MNSGPVQHESERIAIQPLHSLSEGVVDELLKHRSIDPSHFRTRSLLRRINLGKEDSIASTACDHVVSRCIGGSVGGEDEGLLAREDEGVGGSGVEAESCLVEEEDVSRSLPPEFAAEIGDLLTQVNTHCRGSERWCSGKIAIHSLSCVYCD